MIRTYPKGDPMPTLESMTVYEQEHDGYTLRLVCHDPTHIEAYYIHDDGTTEQHQVSSVTVIDDQFFIQHAN